MDYAKWTQQQQNRSSSRLENSLQDFFEAIVQRPQSLRIEEMLVPLESEILSRGVGFETFRAMSGLQFTMQLGRDSTARSSPAAIIVNISQNGNLQQIERIGNVLVPSSRINDSFSGNATRFQQSAGSFGGVS